MLTKDFKKTAFHAASSKWLRSFSLKSVKVLIVCRGPVRKEAYEVFEEIGVREYGMLLSQKDSIVYPGCLAPELRSFKFQKNIHRVPDYMGVGQSERLERIQEIIEIAKSNGYTHLFAGYGFMAEDAEFLQAIEDAGLGFIGPSAEVARRAGAKDEAKKLARGLGNAVIPGIDATSAMALLKKAKDRKALEKLAKQHGLDFVFDADEELEGNAERLLLAGYARKVELVSIEELQRAAEEASDGIWQKYPGKRIRFKHIGGGGGKGQRVVSERSEVANAVMDILAESKVVEPGSNRNFLIELNLESTRHNEIQLIGNGEWCLSMGGRDCSLQMHEQKLLEVSLTQELLDEALSKADGKAAETLRGDKETLRRMEEEGERFGAATNLNSVSTFECIVEGFDHFFMEMNTRIQVEHRVTELAYRLRFTNPDKPEECFYLDSLIEAMALLSLHGDRLDKPERVLRNISGAEARINATNSALQPHAGGVIKAWSAPIEGEIRDDQGIGTRNPDTGSFMFYNLAGAYDSNIALVLTTGTNRLDNLERLAEILRVTELLGENLETNLPVHYGLISWLIGQEPMLKPTTRFMEPYLAAVGSLQSILRDVDIPLAGKEMHNRQPNAVAKQVINTKQTLLLRPLERLLANPHWVAGFIGLNHGKFWEIDGEEINFLVNPVNLLDRLYHYLHMEYCDVKPASEMIWAHDNEKLQTALSFYRTVSERTGITDWEETQAMFAGKSNAALDGGDPELWQRCVESHSGMQLGLNLLTIIPRVGLRSGFTDIKINGDSYEPIFPSQFLGEESDALIKHLSPVPKSSSDQIVAPSGGSFFTREAPHLPQLINEGDHFEKGQPLFIIEVMKMFNKVSAPFSGTVTKSLMKDADGTIVKRGQSIFEVEPDQVIHEKTDEEVSSRRSAVTKALLPS